MVVAHAFNLSTKGAEAGRSEFEASLVGTELLQHAQMPDWFTALHKSDVVV